MAYPPGSLTATGIIFGVICIAFTAVRFWVRLSYSRAPIGLDDCCILVGTLTTCALDGMQAFNGILGQLSSNTDKAKADIITWKANYAQVIIEKVAYGAIKLSLLFFYRRIFRIWRSFRVANNIAVAVIGIWAVVYLFTEAFSCGIHPEVQWNDRANADAACINPGVYLVTFAVTDVFTDLMVILMPFPYVGRLQMGRKQRWAVKGVFVMGFLSTLAAVFRLMAVVTYYRLGQFAWIPDHPNPNIITEIINPVFYVNLELTCGVVAANLPPLWPLLRNCFKGWQCCGRKSRRSSSQSPDVFEWTTTEAKSEVSAMTTTQTSHQYESSVSTGSTDGEAAL